jgi:hypothetical protein
VSVNLTFNVNPGGLHITVSEIGMITSGQDGAAWGNLLFRFDARGRCTVLDCETLTKITAFTLDGIIVPHCNTVVFGCYFYRPEDEFPLLYCNIYNNYAGRADEMHGTCLVYRLTREGVSFKSKLVQIIRLSFTDDRTCWAPAAGKSARPFGNFVIDTQKEQLIAYVMRSEPDGTGYFKLRLPSAHEGYADAAGVKRVILDKDDIISSFTGPYARYLQGGTVFGTGLISSEGFDKDTVNRPALRIIDLGSETELAYVDLLSGGITGEPELVTDIGGCLYLSDARGRFYRLDIHEL